MEETHGSIWRELWFLKKLRRWCQLFCKPHDSRIFVGHHDRTGAVLCITKNGVVRGTIWTRQPLKDAWDATNWDGLCGTPWHMVALELKLTRKSQLTKEERDLHCQGLYSKEFRRLSQEGFTCCLLTLKLTVTQEVVRVAKRWHHMEERSNQTTTNGNDECIQRQSRRDTRERNRARVEQGVGRRCAQGTREWWASGGSTCGRIWRGRENQHKENRMRDVHIAKRGTETAN